MTTQAEILTQIEDYTHFEEAWRDNHGGSINPELLAMKAVLHNVESRHYEFIRKRMAMDAGFFQEDRIRPEDFGNWQAIRSEIIEYTQRLPKQLKPISREWRPVLRDVLRLYGSPHGE